MNPIIRMVDFRVDTGGCYSHPCGCYLSGQAQGRLRLRLEGELERAAKARRRKQKGKLPITDVDGKQGRSVTKGNPHEL